MNTPLRFAFSCFFAIVLSVAVIAAEGGFSIEQVKSYPFPNELATAATGSRMAWGLNERGLRNVWVAEGPDFRPRQLTQYAVDDGQEIASLQISRDGKWVVYVRGGDSGSNFDHGLPVNVLHQATPPKVQIFAVPFAGGEPKALGEGRNPVVAPTSDRVAFTRERAIWLAPIDGKTAAQKAIAVNGDNGSPEWSPDGARLAFVSTRGDHSFVGVYSGDKTGVRWIAPTTNRDSTPKWSPDGKRIVFMRRPGAGGAPEPILEQRPTPWALWTADAATGEARPLWQSPETLRGSIPTTHGGVNLHWAAGGRIVFLSYMDGWPHLYSIPEGGGEPLLLTPGRYMAEYIELSADGRTLTFTGNAGPDSDDVDRRHLVRVPVDRAEPEVLTPGAGLEWTPAFTGDGASIAFIGATAQRPPLPAVMSLADKKIRWLGEERIPADFPAARLVTPKKIILKAPDGLAVHGQLFEPAPGAAAGKRPAIVYIHGGPMRQMLLGWHYSDYYANAYSLNQYLASRGFAVLAVNYRLGIGYEREFHHPKGGGAQGAAEYQDIKAAAEWLRTQPQIDAARIGVYGGSYGGFLTALALARNSNLFAAGVDIHGVHDWDKQRNAAAPRTLRDAYDLAPDAERAVKIAWESSPVSAVPTWRSPVLLIHADDDRNVRFSHTVDLVRRLAAARVPHEEIVIPDDTHHFMLHANQVRVNAAVAEFFERKFLRGRAEATGGSNE